MIFYHGWNESVFCAGATTLIPACLGFPGGVDTAVFDDGSCCVFDIRKRYAKGRTKRGAVFVCLAVTRKSILAGPVFLLWLVWGGFLLAGPAVGFGFSDHDHIL